MAEGQRTHEGTGPGKLFSVFLRLGLTCFGGPVAHLGYFRNEFVVRRAWLDEQQFAELVGLCQILPGPTSSQVSIAIGLSRAGFAGALASWAGFTLPSAILMLALAAWVQASHPDVSVGWLHGLKLVAVPVVTQAVWKMQGTLCADWPRRTLAAAMALAMLVLAPGLTVLAMLACALAGIAFLKPARTPASVAQDSLGGHRQAMICLTLLALLMVGLPLAASTTASPALEVASAYFDTGALVFGGGHVVLPLLQSTVVASGWVSQTDFLTGYGAAQAMPGPLFSIAAFLGSLSRVGPHGIRGACLALAAIFLPSFFLIGASLPILQALRTHSWARCALSGLNAGVVGLLFAVLINPVIQSSVTSIADGVIALAGFCALEILRWPAWSVVGLVVLASTFGAVWFG